MTSVVPNNNNAETTTTRTTSGLRQRRNTPPEERVGCKSSGSSTIGSTTREEEEEERKIHGPPQLRLDATNSSSSINGKDDLCDDNNNIEYFVAKWAMLRLLGFVYLLSFVGAYYQNPGLIGSNGLQPAGAAMASVRDRSGLLDESSVSSVFWDGFAMYPTVFWWIDPTDASLGVVTVLGIVLSSLVAVVGLDSWFVMFLLWLLHFSIVTLADFSTSFYSYGWESQLLETGFLAIFLCDLPRLAVVAGTTGSAQQRRKFSFHPVLYESSSLSSEQQQQQAPSWIVLWLFRWLTFRISMGAGLIKVRGSSCWTEKTCLYYHFETQPIPSPLSFFFHFLPKTILSKGVDLDLFVQLYTSWFVLVVPLLNRHRRRFVAGTATAAGFDLLCLWLLRTGGFIQVGFMVNIILSGNFAALNHLTIVPALACLDDACWPRFLQPPQKTKTTEQQDNSYVSANYKNNNKSSNNNHKNNKPKDDDEDTTTTTTATSSSISDNNDRNVICYHYSSRIVLDKVVFATILYLSWPVVANLLQWGPGQRQQMNASFTRLRLVNTYGAFGSVGEARYEAIISVMGHNSTDDGWVELELPCKPGAVTRRPCFCAPYHYRLDWNIWFLGFKPHKRYLQQRETWMYNLLQKLLQNNHGIDDDDDEQRPWLDLFDSSSSETLREWYRDNNSYPKYAKVDMYRYQMAAPLWTIVQQSLSSSLGINNNNKNKDDNNNNSVIWWKRRFEESLIPPVAYDSKRKQLYWAKESADFRRRSRI